MLAIILVVLAITSVNCVSGEDGSTLNDSENHSNVSINPTIIPTLTATMESDLNASIEPTRVYITTEKQQLFVGGQGGWIVAQLYYKGETLRKKGVNLTFSLNNDKIAVLPRIKNNTTDESGTSMIFLWSTDIPGRIKVSVSYDGDNGAITNSTYVDAVIWGNIGGLVRDKNDYGPPNTNVSLWSCHYNDSSGKWEKENLLDIPENPQLTNDGRTGPAGQFAFYRVPAGTYVIMAEKEGHRNLSVVTIEQNEGASNTQTSLVRLQDYGYNWSGFPQVSLPSATLNCGTIWGIVEDQNKVSMPHANVTL